MENLATTRPIELEKHIGLYILRAGKVSKLVLKYVCGPKRLGPVASAKVFTVYTSKNKMFLSQFHLGDFILSSQNCVVYHPCDTGINLTPFFLSPKSLFLLHLP